MSVTEWMIGIGRLMTLPNAEQHQQTVARVDYRVDRLGEHRGTAGERGSDKLRHRNREVPRDRGIDRKRRFRNSPPARTHWINWFREFVYSIITRTLDRLCPKSLISLCNLCVLCVSVVVLRKP